MKREMKHTTRAIFVLLLILTVLAGCNRSKGGGAGGRAAAAPGSTADGRTAGGSAGAVNRIISTAPSNTEIIAGLGLADRIIAADKYSLELPELKRRGDNGLRDAAEIDFFYPDPEAIISLDPDMIITSEHNVYGAGDDPFRLLKEMGITVVYLPTSNSIAGIYRDIETIAAVLGVTERGSELVRNMKEQIDSIAAIGNSIAVTKNSNTAKKSVYMEISPSPNMVTVGRETFLNEMIELIGAQNIFADKTGWLAPGVEAILERDPDVILTNVNFIDDPIGEIKGRDGFASLGAVREGAVYTIDTDSSSRPSQHIILALEQMARAVYPEYYACEAGAGSR
ncbi:ABC transporter substrate-binding protein [Spirochaetia bacterium]|nr:ABC transporter substrate-binding protein [Spirochaetia bacterium]